MAKKSEEFFEEKKIWSLTKDSILKCYLTPYFAKILKAARNGLVYVDGFAGAGKFDDGSDGSPIIAIEKLREAYENQRCNPQIKMIFSEQDPVSRDNLKKNVYEAVRNINYLQGEHITILENFDKAMNYVPNVRLNNSNLPSAYFYYVDPCGIRDIKFNLFGTSPVIDHTEILFNFCSVGFLRECCALKKIIRNIPDDATDISIPMPDNVSDSDREARLTTVLGSDGWHDVLDEFSANKITFWKAEQKITELLQQNMSQYFKYVLNMPIKDMSRSTFSDGLLKYRLIYATNNADGCVIMNDNMLKRDKENQSSQDKLFLLNVDGTPIDVGAVQKTMRESVMYYQIDSQVTMAELVAPVIVRHGVFDKSSNVLKEYLGPLLDEGLVERAEKKTKTGRQKRSFSDMHEKVFRTR